MTMLEMTICVTAFYMLSSAQNSKFSPETHHAVAANICAAANKHSINPQLLAAYILTENSYFDPFRDKAARVGVDKGLYHTNSHYHGNRPNYELVNHPYYATEIAASIIHENFTRFGTSWQAIAAYWNPMKAQNKTADAKDYYERWLKNFRKAEKVFNDASIRINSTPIQSQ